MTSTFFVLRYDFRAPGVSRSERQELYARALEQAPYVEQHGFGGVTLSEHHASDDGYLPSPIPVASAVAAVTSTIPISISALLANLYDPVRLAEDIVVLDHLSAGRVSYTFGLGYRPEEYAHFGREWSSRGRAIEQQLTVLLQLLTGEEVEVDGRRVRVSPPPYSDPHPVFLYGGGTPAAARRAARLGMHFSPQQADPALKQLYRDTCAELGRKHGFVMMPPEGPAAVFCSEDPDRFWAEHGRHLLADAQGYSRWSGAHQHHVRDDSGTVAELRAAGRYVVGTPDELIARGQAGTLPLVTAHAACGGLPAEPSWESLRLLAEKVKPAIG
ncbi:LLM class flavin-dependent oxidoreductase [Nocardioides massiliensis]|uniref:Alkanesulfonate monooxygenase SsuD/methylene tetrahydromethanopterin reductase-like flavin-dependent oxidoreductase (Luciferase family) n=1 Tax=Nocardioides massiliensis TaxID=1325935 RepID=A0ABT9NP03_9ACTN|nr:LLM class flavin-dependent oxidoreductase [Nocardioides massiliensis]MDP9822157.1 alkanesulfonate monooxygenase SsuD/methylene tetrahydromethanopterin reductase-like flavin-dependent oxidoreductase (luciferase family) [Nocardioides massiliensis]